MGYRLSQNYVVWDKRKRCMTLAKSRMTLRKRRMTSALWGAICLKIHLNTLFSFLPSQSIVNCFLVLKYLHT